MKKAILNTINKWGSALRPHRDSYNHFQLGVLFNELKDSGEISPDKMKQYSLEYAMLLDHNKVNEELIVTRAELNKLKSNLAESLILEGPMDVSFCAGKIGLRYTDFNEDDKAFLSALLREIDKTLYFLCSELDEKTRIMHELTHQNTALTYQITDIYNSNTWKTGKMLQKIFRFLYQFVESNKSY